MQINLVEFSKNDVTLTEILFHSEQSYIDETIGSVRQKPRKYGHSVHSQPLGGDCGSVKTANDLGLLRKTVLGESLLTIRGSRKRVNNQTLSNLPSNHTEPVPILNWQFQIEIYNF